ncbi:glycoside hydrolase family 88 protein [Pusillimonas sp. SM2304]|uniref:glycoside hydrolase family 88 protein n=1 Tax=Pusillimonas sp. SM2304 TaxID=3073241 RepID=UPI002874B828|nr:glycoside hydrolase family 88 protein [Pusillimonas sp. SM2304]MDS1139061.1 glycoside hydrolase family 88 protein [Pusillimonas sp. SM2304]
MNLEELVRRVSAYVRDNPNERDCWQKAPALTGLLAWDMEEFRPTVRKWIDRAVATQKSDGNLSYGDWHTSSGGHIRSFTPLASETAAVGAPMLDLFARHRDSRYLDSAAKQYQSLCDAPRTSEGGIWSRGEGPELWIDFTYLMCPFMAKFGKLSGNEGAIDEAFKQFEVHVRRLVDAEFKLARHAWCEKPNHFPQSTFWARGNGWLLACCAELLRIAPDHSGAAFVKQMYAEVLGAMSSWQDASGYFFHVLDDPLSNLEASSTLMYAYSAEEAIQLGIQVDGVSQAELREKAIRAFTVVAGGVEASGKVPGVAMVPGGPGVPFDWTLFGQGFFLLAAHVLRPHLADLEI